MIRNSRTGIRNKTGIRIRAAVRNLTEKSDSYISRNCQFNKQLVIKIDRIILFSDSLKNYFGDLDPV